MTKSEEMKKMSTLLFLIFNIFVFDLVGKDYP